MISKTIRLAGEKDLPSIRKVIETSFSAEENKAIMKLVAALSIEASHPPVKSLIAELDGHVIGYVSFSPISHKSASPISGYILSPLGVSANHQKQGIGSSLIKTGIEMLTKDGVDVLLVYGDPAYYGRFGFREKTALSFVPPYPLARPFGWLGMMISEASAPMDPIKFECAGALSKPELW